MNMYKKLLQELMPPVAWRFSGRFLKSINKRITHQQPTGEVLIEKKAESVRGIFIHIHKCAGSSLINAFINNPVVISCIARPGNFPGRTGRERIPDAIFDKSVKFTFVRNPYARVVSAYRMFMTSMTWRYLFPTFKDFVDFLRWTNVHDHHVEKQIPTNEYTRTIGNLIHHCSSYHNPKYMIDQMDYIGRLETLDIDLKKIAKMLEINHFTVPHINKLGKAYDYRDYYSQFTREIINKLYQEDIDLFGYQF